MKVEMNGLRRKTTLIKHAVICFGVLLSASLNQYRDVPSGVDRRTKTFESAPPPLVLQHQKRLLTAPTAVALTLRVHPGPVASYKTANNGHAL